MGALTFYLYKVPRTGKFTETENSWFPGAEGGELLFTGDRVSVWDKETVLEKESGDGCKTLSAAHLKWSILCIFSHTEVIFFKFGMNQCKVTYALGVSALILGLVI